MQMAFLCPVCEQQTQCECNDQTTELHCAHCDWVRHVPEGTIERGAVKSCVACGCEDLWKQRDFPQWLGVILVALAALLSTIAIAYYEIVWAIGILLFFGLLDYVFYAVMPDVLVCYRCKARYRHSAGESDVPKFNLETHERYRQEEIRLGNSAGQLPSSRSQV